MPRKTSDELLATKNAKIATQFVFIPFHRLGSFAQTIAVDNTSSPEKNVWPGPLAAVHYAAGDEFKLTHARHPGE